MQQLITVKEYAQLKRISENTVRRRIDSGEIAVERFGRAVRIVLNVNPVGFELVDLPAYLSRNSERKKGKKGTKNFPIRQAPSCT